MSKRRPIAGLAIDSKLWGCDVVALKVEDVAPNGYAVDRATVRQKKTGQPVRFYRPDRSLSGLRYLTLSVPTDKAPLAPQDIYALGRHAETSPLALQYSP